MEPSNNNYDIIRRGLDYLTEGLKPFVEQQMRVAYGEGWEQESRNALRIPAHARLNWDAAALLKLIDRKWEEVFRKILETKKVRSWVNESLELRNEYAHSHSSQPFSDDDALRGLDTIGRLLSAVSSSESEKVIQLKAAIIEKTIKSPEPVIGREKDRGPSTPSPKRIWRVGQTERNAASDGTESRYSHGAKPPTEIKAAFQQFFSEFDAAGQSEIWDEQKQTFKRFWKEKILNPDYELMIPEDTDPIIRILDTSGRGHQGGDESVARTGWRQGQRLWELLFDDLKNKKNIQTTMDQIFDETEDSGLVSLINCLERENKQNGNGLTGKSAVAINALLFINDPPNFLKIVSLSHRFKIMRAFELGNPDDFKNYGEEIVLSNHKITNGFKEIYGIDTEPIALTEFLYSPSCWGRTYRTNIKPMWDARSSSKSKNS